MKTLGWLLILGGAAGVLYFSFGFDTTLAAPQISRDVLGVERVQNLGLMGDRQTGIIVSCVVLIIGVLLAVLRPAPPVKFSPPQSETTPADYLAATNAQDQRQPVSEKRLRAIVEKMKLAKPQK